jgi:hypothetical protein
VDAFKHPSVIAESVNEALSWPNLCNALASATESASDSLQDTLNRTFEGHDVPAIHDRVMSLMPSISLTSLRQVSQSMDSLTDKVQTAIQRRNSMAFIEEEMAGDHLAFAYRMGAAARCALVTQGVCKAWQIESRESVKWRVELDAALSSLFKAKKDNFSIEQWFSMKLIWSGDIRSKTWKLELDTGMAAIVVEFDSDAYEAKRVCLPVAFALPEAAGHVRIQDVERGMVDEEDWMAVE